MSTFPNEQQKKVKVIEHKGKPLVVVAGPGTGKTATIVERMIRLLKEDCNRHVSFITFTRTSRKDTARKINESISQNFSEESNLWFPRTSTLHAFAKAIVHRFAKTVKCESDFSVLIDDREKQIVLKELKEDLDLKDDTKKLERAISYCRCFDSWPEGFCKDSKTQQQVMPHFEKLLRFYNTFDVEGLVAKACEILSNEKDSLPPIFLQVDEYQDLNKKDQELVRLVSSRPGSQIVVVGDDAQSIYGFRHANPSGIRDIWKDPQWEPVMFVKSHRLPIPVLRAAQALIANEGYLGGKMDVPKDNGKKVLTLRCTTSNLQLQFISAIIKRILKDNHTDDKKKTLSYKDFMILCPTFKLITTAIKHLNQDGIPTKQRQKSEIPNELWNLLLVLRMLHSKDSLALRQWLEVCGVTADRIAAIRREAMTAGKSLFKFCATLKDPTIKQIYSGLATLKEAQNNIKEFQKALSSFPCLATNNDLFSIAGLPMGKGTNDNQPVNVSKIIRSLYEEYGLMDQDGNADISTEDKVLVTTMHSAKGLEAKVVFIPWLNYRFMPGSGRDKKEKRRVLYVALTRAKECLVLLFDEIHTCRWKSMSPFLEEIKDCLDVKRVNKDSLTKFKK